MVAAKTQFRTVKDGHGIDRVLNWVPGRPDDFAAAWSPAHRLLAAPTVLPLSSFATAWDQGQEGSCTGHGTGRTLCHRVHVETGQFFRPSCQFIYYCERNIEGDVKQDNGAIVADGIKALMQWGCPPESLWPYTKPFDMKPSKAAYAAAMKHIGLEAQSVPASVDALKQAIAAGNPLTGGFTVKSSFMSQAMAEDGLMRPVAKREKTVGGHCVCWDGYDDTFEAFGTKGFFYCANSWGQDWGLKTPAYRGWFMMPYENIKFCSDFHVLLKVKA